MTRKLIGNITTSLCVISLVTECAVNSSKVADTKPTNGHVNGTVISITPIKVPDTSPNVKTFKMMYWSDNTRTVAYMSVPIKSGSYPLLVNCHGGFSFAMQETHVPSPANQDTLEGASSTFIQVVPEYRGYDDSDGTVPGLDGETLDTNNAIKAVESHYHVNPDHIDVLGTSMGGAVVLKLASERTDIHSVLAVSPFVGWDSMGEWAKNNLKNPAASKWYNDMTTVYGPFKPSSPKYQAVSIDYTKIHAPTLLLQGTADPTVPWQSVQFFYNELKHTNKNTHLILVPGAGHGVHDKTGQNDINQWYVETGM